MMSKNLIIRLVCVGIISLWAGCAALPQRVDMAQFSQTPNDTVVAPIKPPSYIIQRKTPRVAIMNFADHTSAKKLSLGSLATEIFHNVVLAMGRFQVVERAQAGKLAKEIGYQEEHGASWEALEKKYFALGKEIDYVIVGSVNWASPSVTQRPGNQQNPPMCEAKIEVALSARVIDMSTGQSVRTFEMKGSEVEIKRFGCQVTPGMARKAVGRTVKVEGPVQIAMAIPMYGYISKIMTDTKNPAKKIAYINLGHRDGIQPGDSLIITEIKKEVDPISGKTCIRHLDIGKAVVAENGLTDTESIAVINDANTSMKVMVGHVVQTTAERAKAEAATQKAKDAMKQIWQTIIR